MADTDKESARCQISIQTAYGDSIPCELHLGLLPSEDEEFPGTVGVLRDITERQRREQRLMVLNRVLRHNLRNDLNVIIGHAERLEQQVADELRKSVLKIGTVAQELADLGTKARDIESTLDVGESSTSPVDLVAVVDERIDLFRQRFPNAEIEQNTPPSAVVQAGPMVKSVIDNVIENAIEHHDRNQPTVTLIIDTNTHTREFVTLRVADDGPGITAMERVSLEMGEETNLSHGSGLGLWMSKWVTESYGGEFSVEAETPRGTIVTIGLKPVSLGPKGDQLPASLETTR